MTWKSGRVMAKEPGWESTKYGALNLGPLRSYLLGPVTSAVPFRDFWPAGQLRYLQPMAFLLLMGLVMSPTLPTLGQH